MHSHGFKAYLGRVPSQSMISVIRNTSQMHAVNQCAVNNVHGHDGFHQSHCPLGAHVRVSGLICCGLLWSGNVCGFDLALNVLSPYVTPYRFWNNCPIFKIMSMSHQKSFFINSFWRPFSRKIIIIINFFLSLFFFRNDPTLHSCMFPEIRALNPHEAGQINLAYAPLNTIV